MARPDDEVITFVAMARHDDEQRPVQLGVVREQLIVIVWRNVAFP